MLKGWIRWVALHTVILNSAYSLLNKREVDVIYRA